MQVENVLIPQRPGPLTEEPDIHPAGQERQTPHGEHGEGKYTVWLELARRRPGEQPRDEQHQPDQRIHEDGGDLAAKPDRFSKGAERGPETASPCLPRGRAGGRETQDLRAWVAISAGEERPQQLHGVVVSLGEPPRENAADLVGIPLRGISEQGRKLWLLAQEVCELETHGEVDVGFETVDGLLAMRGRREVGRAAVAGRTPKHRGEEPCKVPSLIISGHAAPLRSISLVLRKSRVARRRYLLDATCLAAFVERLEHRRPIQISGDLSARPTAPVSGPRRRALCKQPSRSIHLYRGGNHDQGGRRARSGRERDRASRDG